jgi:hypothetical protein
MLGVIDHAVKRLALKWTADVQYLTGYWELFPIHYFKSSHELVPLFTA